MLHEALRSQQVKIDGNTYGKREWDICHEKGTTTPTFLVVGCQRCGTTWVDAALREHPQIYLPAKKQSYFFDGHYERGIAWYLANFEEAEPRHLAIGEVATGYCLPHAVPRLARHLPQIRLIMTMRNPVERVYSGYVSSKSEHAWRSFDEYMAQHALALERGHYAEQVEALFSHYDRSRVLLLFYDDLVSNDAAYLREIHAFIGVDENVRCNQLGKMRNSATLPRLRYYANRAGLRSILRALSRSPLGDLVRRAKSHWSPPRPRAMEPGVRERLIEYYRPWNARLAGLTGRDLSGWDH
jgi:hypothetical protein